MKLVTLAFISITLTYPYNISKNTLEYDSVEMSIVSNDFLPELQDINMLLSGEFTGFLYIGRDTCPVCLEFNPILRNFYSNNNNLNLYMFDTDFWREDYYFDEVLSAFNITSVPSLLRINDNGEFNSISIDVSLEENLLLELQDFFE